MTIPPDLDTVEKFLDELRAICGLRPNIDILQRNKNREFIQRSGITENEINEIIFVALNPGYYKSGPETEQDNRFPPGVIYKFNYQWKSFEIYIKIKIFIAERRTAICMSFHD